MTTFLPWLEMAKKASQQADELNRVLSDMKLQCRKIQSTIDGLKDLSDECKKEAENADIALEEVQSDVQIEEKLEGQTFPSDGCMDDE